MAGPPLVRNKVMGRAEWRTHLDRRPNFTPAIWATRANRKPHPCEPLHNRLSVCSGRPEDYVKIVNEFSSILLNMARKYGVWFKKPAGIVLALAVSMVTAWPKPQTSEMKGVVVSAKGAPIADALCTLKGVGLPTGGIVVTTDERGRFDFPGLQPGQYGLSCAAVGHLPATQIGLKVSPANPQVLQVVLPEPEKLHQTVEVHETAAPLATESATVSRHVSSQQLNSLPLVQEQFKAALPLVPGVVRTPDGKINIKGSGEGQSMLLADSTEMVDPITGSYSIDLPIDAIESVDVTKAPYNAEYAERSAPGKTTYRLR